MTLLHGIAGGCAVGLLTAVIVAAWPWVVEAMSDLRTRLAMLGPTADEIAAVTVAVSQHGLLIMLGAACLVLTPLALYFALSDD
jgi:hypothetical protein